MKKYWIGAAVVILLVGVYAVSSAGINTLFSSMQKKHSPGRGKAIYSMAGVCKNTFRYEHALEILDYALAQYPDHPAARNGRYNYALCLERLGRNKEAIAAYYVYLSIYAGDTRTEKVQERIDEMEATATSRSDYRRLPLWEVC